ncbi:MAG: SEC-C domain-containing protein [Planctomycetes bacterium]|nr:SEC-C domain-containing protein [Planctomycetota bacterium]
MWDRIRETVTDRIFKVRLSADAQAGASAYGKMQVRHDEATGAGFAGAAADQAAAMKAQNQPQKVETIRREEVKVGRNQPCPCGSGKKYKQCHGKGQ